MAVDKNSKPVAEQRDSAVEKLFSTFFSNLKQKYSKRKKIIDIVATIVLVAIVAIIVYTNNVAKSKENAAVATGNFFVQLYNNSDDMFVIGESILSNHLGKEGTESALFLLANQYLERKNDTLKAKEIFEAIMDNYPQNDIVSFATSKLAYLNTHTDPSKSVILFESLIKNFSSSPLANSWRMDLARLLADSNKPKSIELCEYIVKTETRDVELKQQASNLLAILTS